MRRHPSPSLARPSSTSLSSAELLLAHQVEAAHTEQRRLTWALGGALAFHLGLLLLSLPAERRELRADTTRRPLFLIRPIRFEPRPPETPQRPKRRALRVPMPDPTPHDPEPLPRQEIAVRPDIEIDDLDLGVIAVPPPTVPQPPAGPMRITPEMEPPVKVYAPAPRYTELARKARVSGVVVLQAIIDETGAVTEVEVLRGLSMGLGEEAQRAVSEWRFEPARLGGRPVAVYLTLTIHFDLQ